MRHAKGRWRGRLLHTLNMTHQPFNIRHYEPADEALVTASWVNSNRNSHWARAIGHPLTYERTQRRIIAHQFRLLPGDLSDSWPMQLKVACDPRDPTHIFGWACWYFPERGDRTVLHYIYVKPDFRRLGVGAGLAGAMVGKNARLIVVSHATDRALQLAENVASVRNVVGCEYPPYLRYNPMLAVWPDAEVAI